MSKQCDLCVRSSMKGAIRSHANNKTNKRQKINLQSKKIDGIKIKICSSCLKTAKRKQETKAVAA